MQTDVDYIIAFLTCFFRIFFSVNGEPFELRMYLVGEESVYACGQGRAIPGMSDEKHRCPKHMSCVLCEAWCCCQYVFRMSVKEVPSARRLLAIIDLDVGLCPSLLTHIGESQKYSSQQTISAQVLTVRFQLRVNGRY